MGFWRAQGRMLMHGFEWYGCRAGTWGSHLGISLGVSLTWSFSGLEFLPLGFSLTWSFPDLEFPRLGVSPTWSFWSFSHLFLGRLCSSKASSHVQAKVFLQNRNTYYYYVDMYISIDNSLTLNSADEKFLRWPKILHTNFVTCRFSIHVDKILRTFTSKIRLW